MGKPASTGEPATGSAGLRPAAGTPVPQQRAVGLLLPPGAVSCGRGKVASGLGLMGIGGSSEAFALLISKRQLPMCHEGCVIYLAEASVVKCVIKYSRAFLDDASRCSPWFVPSVAIVDAHAFLKDLSHNYSFEKLYLGWPF